MNDKARTLPKRLAGIVELLELEQPRIVTLSMICSLAQTLNQDADSLEVARRLAYRLESLGWLGRLRTRGAWEFLPGARAGAYSSQDRLIEFRAQMEVNPDWRGVLAMESAAMLLGLAQRLPVSESVALPSDEALPKAMSSWHKVSLNQSKQGLTVIDGLPTWNLEGLLAGIAMRPSAYHDLVGLAQWLPEISKDIDTEQLMACLENAPLSAWQRAAYLTALAKADDTTNELLAKRPPKAPIWFSANRNGGLYHSASKVSDADLAPLLKAGVAQ